MNTPTPAPSLREALAAKLQDTYFRHVTVGPGSVRASWLAVADAAMLAALAHPSAQNVEPRASVETEPVGIVQRISIAGYPMVDSTGVEWLSPIAVGTKLYIRAGVESAAKPAQAAGALTERAKFEKWWLRKAPHVGVEHHPNKRLYPNSYVDGLTNAVWDAWQAASSPAQAEELWPEIHDTPRRRRVLANEAARSPEAQQAQAEAPSLREAWIARELVAIRGTNPVQSAEWGFDAGWRAALRHSTETPAETPLSRDAGFPFPIPGPAVRPPQGDE